MDIADRLLAEGGWIDRPGCRSFNLYRPPLPPTGDGRLASRWLDHVRAIYPEEADHIVRWLAHRVQRPHEKINHALVLGGAQGIGKDTLLEPVKRAIGRWNWAEVSPQQLLGRFNGFARSVMLRVSEARDLGERDRLAFYEHMKPYCAAPPDVLRVDEKHLREVSVLNVCGVIMTTNHKTDGVHLPADDRRHFVAWSNKTKEDFTGSYWSGLYRWYDEGGAGHVAAYLSGLDLSFFDSKAPPPKTEAFWSIVDAGRAPEDAELADALEQLGHPVATTLAVIAAHAEPSFADWLLERRNRRQIPQRLEDRGYVGIRNPSRDDGLWKVNGKQVNIYARRELSLREQVTAARSLSEASRCGQWRQ